MGTMRVYIKPFVSAGVYADDYVDVTADVDRNSISSISQKLDNSDFNVGVFSYDSFSLKLSNQSGLYNDVESITSMFRYRRSGSLVKITWLFGEYEPICGVAVCGEAVLGPEETVFEGLLSDVSSAQNIKDQKITFNVLGKESIFEAIETTYSSLTNGDSVSEAIFTALNVTGVTDLLTVNIDNIEPALDFDIDDVSGFENSTVKELLDELLQASNSVLRIIDDTIYVMSRDASDDLMYTFYGQAATDGIEDVADISNYKNGVNRTFNYWTWKDTTLVSKNTTSIDDYGVRKKEVEYDFITNSTTQQNIIDELKSEFGTPKVEFTMKTPMIIGTLTLNLLDKVAVDYPTNTIAIGDELLPIIGVVKVGEFIVPFSEFSLTLSTSDNFKIITKSVDILKEEITLGLRAV